MTIAGHSLARGLGAAVLVAAALAPVVLPGCNILGPASYLLGGLPKIDAEYELLPRTTAIYVDDRVNVIRSSNARGLRLAVADRIARDLMTQELLTPEMVISPRDAMGVVMAHDRHSELMSIDQIAAKVGAEQIIFVEMLGFSNTSDGMTPRPTTTARVRVIDAVNRERLYPTGTTEIGRQVGAEIREVDPYVFQTRAGTLKVHQALAEELGEQIAKLFYQHESREIGSNLEPR